jgi:uncharacterized repeat protein (TIGR03837 family)
MHYRSLDIFCHVVDNFGDIGFVFRFAREFHAANSTVSVRVFVDDMKVLQAIKPAIDPSLRRQSHDEIEYISYAALTVDFVHRLDPADVLVEAFACHIPDLVLQAAESRPRVIINLEHLSAEAWVEGYHLRPSLLSSENLKKYFYMPGFTVATGGVIIDHRIERVKPLLAKHRGLCLKGLLAQSGHIVDGLEGSLVGTVFTYERGFDTLIGDLNSLGRSTVLLVFGDKARKGMVRTLERVGGVQIREHQFKNGTVQVVFMPFISQERYDSLLCCADFNVVRGEESLVRAILAAKPFIWNAYLQDNSYQKVKVEAFAGAMEKYFCDRETFFKYRELLLSFNDAEIESSIQVTREQYRSFFTNLTKIERATREMSYFVARNCNLINQFSAFINSL